MRHLSIPAAALLASALVGATAFAQSERASPAAAAAGLGFTLVSVEL